MSTGTGIEWTNATWNPVVGCTRDNSDCDNCYAVTMTHRLESMGQKKYSGLTVLNGKGDRHFNGVVRTVDEALDVPLGWKKPRRVFVNSMSDLFHKEVPTAFIQRVFFAMLKTPQHTYQVLTKRTERMHEELHRWVFGCGHGVIPNAWFGTSCGHQAAADEKIPHLLKCPATVRFLSVEPMTGPVKLPTLDGIHWVIVGGESGKGARRFDMNWARSIIAQCKQSGVACFVKQLGAQAGWTDADDDWHQWNYKDPKGGDPDEWPEELRLRQFPNTMCK